MDNKHTTIKDNTIKNARASMAKLVDNLISLEMDEIENYEFPPDEPFGLEIIHKDTLFYLIIRFSSKNKNFICIGPGAFERNKTDSNGELITPPFFARWSWYKYLDESVISYADPMIFKDDEIKLGWFIGDKNHWYLETVSSIIQNLAKNQKVYNNNILFFGSSGGGFVSTCLGTLIKNSKVLINNSQLFVLNYYPSLIGKAFELVTPSFKNQSSEEIIKKIEYRIDVTKLFERENYAPNITYYVNVKSEPDILNQTIPLIQHHYNQKTFSGLNIIHYKDEKPEPHNPLPIKTTVNILKLYAKNNLYNSKPTETQNILKPKNNANLIEHQNSKLKKEIKKLRDENNVLKEEITELKSSSSWKVSAPFRKLMAIFRKHQ